MACFRHCVSQDRRRFVGDGFDLDLSYVTERLVASGCPAYGAEQCIRNPHEELRRFLDTKFPEGNYYVINLCSEPNRYYEGLFPRGHEFQFPSPDHYGPPLELICRCAAKIVQLLQLENRPGVIVHCKAGKGRSGVMICAALILLGSLGGQHVTSDEAAALFEQMRGRGIKLGCQQRALKDFESYLKGQQELKKLQIPLNKMKVSGIRITTQNIPELVAKIYCSAGLIHLDQIKETGRYSAYAIENDMELSDTTNAFIANAHQIKIVGNGITQCDVLLYNNVVVDLVSKSHLIGRIQFFVGLGQMTFQANQIDDRDGVTSFAFLQNFNPLVQRVFDTEVNQSSKAAQ